MKRILVIIAVLLTLAGLLLAMSFLIFPFLSGEGYAITGYDGPVATFSSIDDTLSGYGEVVENVQATSAYIYPVSPDIFDLIVCTGLKAEIQAVPNVLSQDLEDTISKSVLDAETETNTTTTVEIYRAKCQMKVLVTTYEGGLATIKDTVFWVQLNDNADSIFSSASDRFAYFVEVYTYELPKQEGSMTVTPSGTGLTIETTSLENKDVPQWLVDAGYTSAGSKFTSVKFPITINTAVPVTYVDIGGMHRAESYTVFYIQFDVILSGKWLHVSDYKESGWPEWPDFWGDLLDAVAQFFWYIAGIVLSILIVLKVKDPRYIAVLLGIVWLVVLWQTGALNQLLGWLGL